jgi:hypothetical protein
MDGRKKKKNLIKAFKKSPSPSPTNEKKKK